MTDSTQVKQALLSALSTGAIPHVSKAGQPRFTETRRAIELRGNRPGESETVDVESLMVRQMAVLDGLFLDLIQKADEAGNYLEGADTYMRLGLKAQAQCRAVAEALIARKKLGGE